MQVAVEGWDRLYGVEQVSRHAHYILFTGSQGVIQPAAGS